MTSVEPEKASVETQIYPDFAFDFESGASFPLDAKVMTAKKMFQILRKESDEHTSLILQKLLDKHIYSRRSLTEAISSLLAAKVCSSDLDEQDLYEVFLKVLRKHRNVVACMVQDLEWCKEIDPATIFYLQPFLFFKGFHAVQLQRMSHALWTEGDEGDKMLALALQSRSAEEFSVDAHPGAVIKHAVLLDHASGIVIGETAAIGHHCYILHGVTLGATGKANVFDRHPKVGNRVKIGAGSMILGNIPIADGAVVGASAIVTVPVAEGETVVGINRILDVSAKQAAEARAADMDTWLYSI